MAKFLDTDGTSAAITTLLREAQKEVVLITPYVQFAKLVLERLEDAADRGVRITVVFGKEDPRQDVLDQIKDLKNIKILFLDNLHAKCYYNESNMVLSSMNLYEFSAKNNREMGVWISSSADAGLYTDAVKEAGSIISRAKEVNVNPTFSTLANSRKIYIPRVPSKTFESQFAFPKLSSKISDSRNDTHAYCVRCKNSLPFNPDHPLCRDCYTNWAKYQNEDFKEKYCHTCGKEHQTSYVKPQCKECYSKSKNPISS